MHARRELPGRAPPRPAQCCAPHVGGRWSSARPGSRPAPHAPRSGHTGAQPSSAIQTAALRIGGPFLAVSAHGTGKGLRHEAGTLLLDKSLQMELKDLSLNSNDCKCQVPIRSKRYWVT